MKLFFGLALSALLTLSISAQSVSAMMNEDKESPAASCPKATSSLSQLFHGICNGNEPEFFAALEDFKSSGVPAESVVDKFGLSPLHWAASLWNMKMVRGLIEAGFSANQVGGSKKNTPLYSAIKGNHFAELNPSDQMPTIRFLVEIGKASVIVTNLDGHTPRKITEDLNLDEAAAYLKGQEDR